MIQRGVLLIGAWREACSSSANISGTSNVHTDEHGRPGSKGTERIINCGIE
jgi:hypothetical protein